MVASTTVQKVSKISKHIFRKMLNECRITIEYGYVVFTTSEPILRYKYGSSKIEVWLTYNKKYFENNLIFDPCNSYAVRKNIDEFLSEELYKNIGLKIPSHNIFETQ